MHETMVIKIVYKSSPSRYTLGNFTCILKRMLWKVTSFQIMSILGINVKFVGGVDIYGFTSIGCEAAIDRTLEWQFVQRRDGPKSTGLWGIS